MNNKFKRVISSILAFTMVISVLTVMNVTTAFAEVDTESIYSSVTAVYDFIGVTTSSGTIKSSIGTSTATYAGAGAGAVVSNNYESSNTGLKITANTGASYKAMKINAKTDFSANHLEIPASDGDTIYVYGFNNSGSDKSNTLLFSTSTTVPEDTSDCTMQITNSRGTIAEFYYTVPSGFTGDTIYIISTDNNFDVAAVAVVGSSATSLKVDQSSASLKVGETLTVNATANNAGENPSITWSSDDTEESIVSLSGTTGSSVTITAIGEGYATITASISYGGQEYTAEVSVNVYIPEISLTVDPTSAKLQAGETVEVTATPVNTEESKDYSISWSSSNTAVATVSPATGNTVTITAVGVGEEDAIITATMTYEEKEYTAEVSVNVYEVTVDDSAALTATAPSTYDNNYTTITTNEDGSVTYSYDFGSFGNYVYNQGLNPGETNYNFRLSNGVIKGVSDTTLDGNEYFYRLSSDGGNIQVYKNSENVKFASDDVALMFSIGTYCEASVTITSSTSTSATVKNTDSGETVSDLSALEPGNYSIYRAGSDFYITKLEITVTSTADVGEINGNTITAGGTTYLIANLDGCSTEEDLSNYDYVYLADANGDAIDSANEGSGTVYTGVKIEGVTYDASQFDTGYKYIYCFAIDSTYTGDVSGYKLVGHPVETTATEE
ncbi:MAG: hypothetical protein LIO87_07415 [Eubacterium sp.]|nr:hypothetical protein [Eubacterium sp.]